MIFARALKINVKCKPLGWPFDFIGHLASATKRTYLSNAAATDRPPHHIRLTFITYNLIVPGKNSGCSDLPTIFTYWLKRVPILFLLRTANLVINLLNFRGISKHNSYRLI